MLLSDRIALTAISTTPKEKNNEKQPQTLYENGGHRRFGAWRATGDQGVAAGEQGVTLVKQTQLRTTSTIVFGLGWFISFVLLALAAHQDDYTFVVLLFLQSFA